MEKGAEAPAPDAVAVNCLLLTRVTGTAHTCGFGRCEAPADWKMVYQKHVFYVCDRHLESGERSAHAQHDTQLKGVPNGRRD